MGDSEGTFVYDGDDALREAIAGASTPGSAANREVYYYNYDGQRIVAVREAAAGETPPKRLWFGATEIWYDQAGTQERTMLHLALGGQLVARVIDGNTRAAELIYHGVLFRTCSLFSMQQVNRSASLVTVLMASCFPSMGQPLYITGGGSTPRK
jgi:hypothetical protein